MAIAIGAVLTAASIIFTVATVTFKVVHNISNKYWPDSSLAEFTNNIAGLIKFSEEVGKDTLEQTKDAIKDVKAVHNDISGVSEEVEEIVLDIQENLHSNNVGG